MYLPVLSPAAFPLASCTTSTKVATVQPLDRTCSCDELLREYRSLDALRKQAEKNKSVNVENVAAFVFFWPAIAGNCMDSEKAPDLVEGRRNHLVRLYDEKDCQGG